MKKIRLFCMLMVICIATMYAPLFTSYAGWAYGTCGDNVSWLYAENELKVYADDGVTNGVMYDYDDEDMPWEDYEDDIHTIVIERGVSYIGKKAFYDLDEVTNIWVKGNPDAPLTIGVDAFMECSGVINLAIGTVEGDEQPITFEYESFENLDSVRNIFLTSKIAKIGDQAFLDADELTNVYFMGTSDMLRAENEELKGSINIVGRDNDDLADDDVTWSYFTDIYSWQCDENGYTLNLNISNWPFTSWPFEFPWSIYVTKLNGHDECYHWVKTPDGEDAKYGDGQKSGFGGHVVENGRCVECGTNINITPTYIDEQGNQCSVNGKWQFLSTKITDITESGWYVVKGELNFGNNRINIHNGADVKFILLDNSKIKTTGGIGVFENSTFTVYSESLDTSENNNMGTIEASVSGDNQYAGIGGYDAKLVFCGGNINADGGKGAAGIGGDYKHSKVVIDIYNGRLFAKGNYASDSYVRFEPKYFSQDAACGAGIGGGGYSGKSSQDGIVTIYNGVIDATTGDAGAGIGSGSNNSYFKVVINGGDITASSGNDFGACIGSGAGYAGDIKPSDATVEINGGNLTLNGSRPHIGFGSTCTLIDNRGVGSLLSSGNVAIIVAIAAAAMVAVVVLKKKKTA